MIVSFGASWPLNIMKAYKSRSTKGVSLAFTSLICIGYVAGIVSKLVAYATIGASYWTFLTVLAFVFYWINLVMVSSAIVIYFRNKKIESKENK